MAHLKILIFNWRCLLSPEAGGAEVFTYEVAKRWVEAGHDVTWFAGEFRDCKKEEVVDGIRIVRAGGKYSLYGKAKKFYRDRFSKEGFDIIIDEINTRPFFTPKFADHGEKIVALIHQLAREYWYYETRFPVSYVGYHFLENRWLRNYVDVPAVTVSESTRQDLLDLGFKRVFIVPEGLNFKAPSGIPDKENFPVIVYVGRLKPAKRPNHAVWAFEIIKEKIPDAELWILGDGPYRKVIENGAIDGVKMFGNLPNTQRRRLISRAWVLVNPSVREGWGLNVVEANALGTLCVGYDVAGLRDSVKDGETGLLSEAGNVNDLAEKVLSVFSDRTMMERLSRNALEYSRGFNWDKTAQEFASILKLV